MTGEDRCCSRGAGHGRSGEPVGAERLAALRTGARTGARTGTAVEGLLARLDVDRVLADVADLAALPTRHSTSPGFAVAADRVEARLTDLGATVRRETFPVGAGTSQNVVGDWPGGPADGVVVLVAHFDSVNLAGGSAADAPGADDNASGAATVLELARLLAPAPRRLALRVLLAGGEEQGLVGSRHHVAGLDAAERARLRAVLNLDMVASRNTAAPGLLVEGAAHARAVLDDVVAAAAAWTALDVGTSLSPYASDHVPFLDAGLPAVLVIEAEDGANDRVHTDRDRPEHLDRDVLTGIARTCLAAAAGWLDVRAPTARRPGVAGPVVAVRSR